MGGLTSLDHLHAPGPELAVVGAGWMERRMLSRGSQASGDTDVETKESGGCSDTNLDDIRWAWAPPWKEGSVPPGRFFIE